MAHADILIADLSILFVRRERACVHPAHAGVADGSRGQRARRAVASSVVGVALIAARLGG
jgi:hypothetical protein